MEFAQLAVPPLSTAVTPLEQPIRHIQSSALAELQGPGLFPCAHKCLTPHNPPMREEADEIAALFERVYHGGYPDARLRFGKFIHDDIAAGKYIGVALFKDSKAVGFGAVGEISAEAIALGAGGRMFELGKLAIDPVAQGDGLGRKLVEIRLEIAREQGADVVSSFAVTNITGSQKLLYRSGFRPSGINIGDWPLGADTHKRNSSVAMHRIVNQSIQDSRLVAVPQTIVPALRAAYASLGCFRKFDPCLVPASLPRTFSSEQELSEQIDPESRAVHFTLDERHDPYYAALRSQEYLSQSIAVTSARLNLHAVGAYEKIAVLLEAGFRFASVTPLPAGDILTLQSHQRLTRAEAAEIQLEHHESQTLLNLILEQESRAAK